MHLGVDEARRPLFNKLVFLRCIYLVSDRLYPCFVIDESLLGIRDFEKSAHLKVGVIIIRVEFNDSLEELDRLQVIIL